MVLILCGKSGSGKDTIAREIVKSDDFNMIVSTTSRPMREGEQFGREYYFIPKDDFEVLIKKGEFIEHRAYDTLVGGQPDTWYYGTEKFRKSKEGEFKVAIKDLEGAKAIKEYCEKIGEPVRAVLVTCPDNIRTERAKMRGSFDETEWNRRLAADEKDFSEDKVRSVIDYELVNDGKWLPGGLAAHLQRYARAEEKTDDMEIVEEIEER